MLDENFGPSIYCNVHVEREVEFYCLKDNVMVCALCVWDHSDHKKEIK